MKNFKANVDVIEPLTIRLLAVGTFAVQFLSSILFLWLVRR